MQKSSTVFSFSYIFQALSLLALTFSMAACDSSDPINMIKPGDNPGNSPKNCDQRCKTAAEAKADKFSQIAFQAGSWAEMILFAALEKPGQGTYWECAKPEKTTEAGKEVLVFDSTNGLDCSQNGHTVSVNFKAIIERNSNDRIERILVQDNSNTPYLSVTTKAAQYEITTDITINKLEIKHEIDKTYSYTSDFNFESIRLPEDDAKFSRSRLATSAFEHNGSLTVAEDDIGTTVNIGSEDDANIKFYSEILTGPNQSKAKNYKSELRIFMEDPSQSQASFCGIPGGRYAYKNAMSTRDVKPGSQYGPAKGYEGLLEVSTNTVKDIISKRFERITTCEGQLIGRLWSVAAQMDTFFADLHGDIGPKSQKARGTNLGKQSGSQATAGEVKKCGEQVIPPNIKKDCPSRN